MQTWQKFAMGIGAGICALGVVLGVAPQSLSRTAENLPRTGSVASTHGASVAVFPGAGGAFSKKTSEPDAGIPVHLAVPAIGVDATVEPVGLDADGNMDVPKSWDDAGWYAPGPRPGAPGRAVIDGHLDSDHGLAVFWKLRQLKAGNEIRVTDEQGKTRIFAVTKTVRYGADAASALQNIFGPSETRTLVLITCGGKWDEKAHRYADRLAVFADLEDGRAQSSLR